MATILQASRWSRSQNGPHNAGTLNKDTLQFAPLARLSALSSRSVSGIAVADSSFRLYNLFCVEGLYTNAGLLQAIIGSSYDSTNDVVPSKLPISALGFCSNIVHRDALTPDAIQTPAAIPVEHLQGTPWEGKSDMFFESRPLAFAYPMEVVPQNGSLLDPAFLASFSQNTTLDAKVWIYHLAAAVENRARVRLVFSRLAGMEATYVSPSFEPDHWSTLSPTVDPLEIPDVEMEDVLRRVKASMRIPDAQTAPARRATGRPAFNGGCHGPRAQRQSGQRPAQRPPHPRRFLHIHHGRQFPNRGRGGHGPPRGSNRHQHRRSRGSHFGSFVADEGATPLQPQGLSRFYCMDFLYTGRFCSRGRSCHTNHISFDQMCGPDRIRFETHIAAVPGLWFSPHCSTLPNHLRCHVAPRR